MSGEQGTPRTFVVLLDELTADCAVFVFAGSYGDAAPPLVRLELSRAEWDREGRRTTALLTFGPNE